MDMETSVKAKSTYLIFRRSTLHDLRRLVEGDGTQPSLGQAQQQMCKL